MATADSPTTRGLVIGTAGPEYVVELLDGRGVLGCVLARGKPFAEGRPVVGDRVAVEPAEAGRGLIAGVEPRRNRLRRVAPGGRQTKVLVANIDTLVVVASAHEPPLRSGLLDRYLAAAEYEGIVPLLCFNKWELASGDDEAIYGVYAALGYDCVRTSAATGDGLAALADALRDRCSALVGHSGVGKTSLMQHLLPDAPLIIGDLTQHGRGRHTTTHAQLLALRGGGSIVDTPGVREFALSGVPAAELGGCFADFAPFSSACRYQPCTHSHEPECAVKDAVEDGAVHRLRYQGYCRLLEELQAQEAQLHS